MLQTVPDVLSPFSACSDFWWLNHMSPDNQNESESHSVVSNCLQPHGLYSPWNSPGQNNGVDSHSLLKGSSQLRDWVQVSCIAGGFFTSWVTREAQEYWIGQPIPSPADLPDPGIKPGSPALQVDSLLAELPGKPPDNQGSIQKMEA